MAGRIYRKHQNRKKLARRYLNKKPFFGYAHSDEYYAWKYLNRNASYDYGYAKKRCGEAYELIKDLTWWEIEEIEEKTILHEAQRRIDDSRWNTNRGTKSYKKKYHRMRRVESRKLEHYAITEQEELFESISPDGWRGAIGWDIW